MEFLIVDAFTDTLFGGNPAGVVILGSGADFPPEGIMQKTAAELRYSETAFVKQTGENTFHTRYFTPEAEVKLCGHATIGAFYALLATKRVSSHTRCENMTRAGKISVEILPDMILMDMAPPKAISQMGNICDLRVLYEVMGLDFEKQRKAMLKDDKEMDLLPEVISTGLPDILLPVADEQALASIKPDFPALCDLSARYEVVGVHAFTLGAPGDPVHCRNFAPLYAIDEEAATGTSNGALTYYLYRNGRLADGAETIFIQGEAMGRPSRIISRLDITPEAESVRIRIGGQAVILAEGDIWL